MDHPEKRDSPRRDGGQLGKACHPEVLRRISYIVAKRKRRRTALDGCPTSDVVSASTQDPSEYLRMTSFAELPSVSPRLRGDLPSSVFTRLQATALPPSP